MYVGFINTFSHTESTHVNVNGFWIQWTIQNKCSSAKRYPWYLLILSRPLFVVWNFIKDLNLTPVGRISTTLRVLVRVYTHPHQAIILHIYMMTSSNGNISRVTGPLCGEFTGHPRKGQWRGALLFSLICARINGWVNTRKVGDFRRNHARYDVTVIPDYDTSHRHVQFW